MSQFGVKSAGTTRDGIAEFVFGPYRLRTDDLVLRCRGAAIPLAITFPVLKYVGFNPVPGAANTPAAIHGLEACFVAAPVVATTLGGLCLWGYHLTASRHEVIRTKLDARDTLALASGGDLSAALDPATHVPVPIEIDAPG